VQAAAGAALGDWADHLATALTGKGLPAVQAKSLAGFIISAIEGAIVQSRALKSTQPLDDAQSHLVTLLAAAIPP
jgi:TetR/AcrR family transcriptional regulator, lmrAB and yxaGH operons repressor